MDSDELRDGYWTGGLVKRWVGRRPVDPPEFATRISGPGTGSCVDCDSRILKKATRCRACYLAHTEKSGGMAVSATIWQTIADNLASVAVPRVPWRTEVTCCDDCGCLLIHTDEMCVGCLVRDQGSTARKAA